MGVDVLEHEQVACAEIAVQRTLQVVTLELERAARHVEQAGDVTALDQTLDHRAGRHPVDVADHAAELDAAVVEHFVQPVDLRAVHIGELAAVTRDQTQLAQVLRGNKAGPNQAEAGQHGEPLRIVHVGLAAGYMQDGSAR